MKNLLKSEGFRAVMLCLIITAAYLPSFSGEFILDDRPFVKENAYLQRFHSPASYLLQEDGIRESESGRFHSGYYRPLVSLTYTLDFKLWGMNPRGFRATNLILHLGTCLILFQLTRLLAGGGVAPFLAVLVYGLHPANTEAVAWIASRNNLLVTLFGLAAFYFYVKGDSDGGRWPGAVSLLCFATALLCKEFAVMLLPVFFLYDRFVGTEGKAFRERLWGYAAFFIIVLAYLAVRKAAIQDVFPAPGAGHFGQALYFAPYLILYNLRIILLPLGLHNFMISYPHEYLGREAVAGLVGAGLIGWILWRERAKRVPVFSSCAFFIALFPVLNIIPTSAYSLISMRWLYFPMSLLGPLAAWLLNGALKTKRALLVSLLVGAGLVYMGTYTLTLNRGLWMSERDFFENEVTLWGNTFYAGDLARILYAERNYPLAERYFQIAVQAYPHVAVHAINYAALLVEMDRPEKALPYLDKAETLRLTKKQRAILFNNRGAAYFKMKEYGKSFESFSKAVGFAPEAPDFAANLARARSSMGKQEKSLTPFKKYLGPGTGRSSGRKPPEMPSTRMGDHADALEGFRMIPQETGD
jgi:tetratricopeptide (TPR) repeat protein